MPKESALPFGDLTRRAFDEIVERAHRARNQAIAAALAWLLRWIVAILAGIVDHPADHPAAGQRGMSS